MVCKFFRKTVSTSEKTCTNTTLCETKRCPYVANGKFLNKKAAEACKGYTTKGVPHKEVAPKIVRSIIEGINDMIASYSSNGTNDKFVITVEKADGTFIARVPVVRNPAGGRGAWMTQKIFCRVNGRNKSKSLREQIKRYRNGRRNF